MSENHYDRTTMLESLQFLERLSENPSFAREDMLVTAGPVPRVLYNLLYSHACRLAQISHDLWEIGLALRMDLKYKSERYEMLKDSVAADMKKLAAFVQVYGDIPAGPAAECYAAVLNRYAIDHEVVKTTEPEGAPPACEGSEVEDDEGCGYQSISSDEEGSLNLDTPTARTVAEALHGLADKITEACDEDRPWEDDSEKIHNDGPVS
jgi:hypothetical protein